MIFYIFMIMLSPFTAVIPMIHAVYLIAKGRVKIEKNYWNISLFLIFLWSIIVAIFNNSLLSFAGAFMLLGYCAISVVAQNYFKNRRRINDSLKIVIYCTSLVAVNGIMEKVVFNTIGKSNHRIYSSFGNPNMTGAWFASTIFIALYLKSKQKTKVEGLIYSATIVLSTVALLFTESTGAIIAFSGAMLVYIVLKLIRSKKGVMLLGVGCVITFISVFLLQQSGKLSAIINEIVASFNSRVDIWQGSLQMIFQKPLTGWGMLGTLEQGVNFFPSNGNSIHSHNLWLTLLTTGGVIGFTIYMYMKYNLMKDVITLFNRKEPMLLLIVALNLMVIIQGLVDVSLYAPQLGIMFMVINSIALNLVKGKVNNKTRIKNSKIISLNKEAMVA